MSDIQKFTVPEQLQILLDENGLAAPDGSLATSEEMGVNLGVTRHYGVEAVLPSGGIGRCVVRQVEQLPEPYLACLPVGHRDIHEFGERRFSGILADVQLSSVSHRGLFVARRALLEMRSRDGGSFSAQSISMRNVGRATAEMDELLRMNVSGLEVIRALEPSEMTYSEPSVPRMVFAALRRRAGSARTALTAN